MAYTVGTLFSGIGVPDLAARLLGMTTVWQVEKEAYPQQVLRKNFPEATLHGDIFDCHNLPHVDVVVAGFPCQPFSLAGKRQGEADERYLVPEMFRVIQEVKPRVVLFENVPGFASIADGDTFKQFLRALAEMGFDAEWGHLAASDFGAPHRRERWWCVAYSEDARANWRFSITRNAAQGGVERRRGLSGNRSNGGLLNVANADQPERQARRGDGVGTREQASTSACAGLVGHANRAGRREQRRAVPVRAQQLTAERAGRRATQPGVCRKSHGTTARMDGSGRRVKHVIPSKAYTAKALRLLRSATGAQALQRRAGINERVQPAKVLRPDMLRISTAKTRRHSGRASQAGSRPSQSILRTVRRDGTPELSSYRRQSIEQRPIKCADVMRLMSYPSSLADWQVDPQAALQVRDLWEATRQIAPGDVRETLPALEEIWRSLSDEKKGWIAIRAGYSAGLNDWPHPARPGEPQHAWEPPRVVTGKQAHRAARLKALGNSMYFPVVCAIMANIRSWLEAQDAQAVDKAA